LVRHSNSLERTLLTWKARLPGPLKKRGANCRIKSITRGGDFVSLAAVVPKSVAGAAAAAEFPLAATMLLRQPLAV
jgi:hypothetical protein